MFETFEYIRFEISIWLYVIIVVAIVSAALLLNWILKIVMYRKTKKGE